MCGGDKHMELVMVPIERVRQDPNQARGLRSLDSVASLGRSIAEVGLLHPLLVRRRDDGDYQLVAGYRRLLAAAAMGLETVPVLILEGNAPALQVQLVENLQREDLNPLEKAMAVKAYMDAAGLSKRAAAQKLGIPRTTITDWLDLLQVDERYQRAVVDNFNGGDSPLTVSHVAEARALAARMGAPGLVKALLDAVLLYHLSKAETREVARLVREHRNLSIRDAVRAVRPNLDEPGEGDASPEVAPDEHNLRQLVRAVDRSTAMIKRMQHLSARFLSQVQRDELIARFQELHEMTGQVLEQLTAPVPAQAAPTRRRGKKRRVS